MEPKKRPRKLLSQERSLPDPMGKNATVPEILPYSFTKVLFYVVVQ